MKHQWYLIIGILLLSFSGCSPVAQPDDPNEPQKLSPQNTRIAQLSDNVKKPLLEITSPRPAWDAISFVKTENIYRWKTAPDALSPKYVRWILVSTHEHNGDFDATLEAIRNSENDPRWSSWHEYRPHRNMGTSWLTPSTDPGKYVFVVQGRGTNGTVDKEFDLNRNARYIHVQQGEMGPLVTMYGDHFDPFETVKLGALIIIDVPPGEPLSFCWTADASNTGSTIATYRYGWDVGDFHDDDRWEIDHTPFDGSATCSPQRIYDFGTHVFTVHVMDAEGRSTYSELKVNILYPGFYRGVLDVRPGSCENTLNVKSNGTIKVVVAGNEDFDVSRIKIASIQLEQTSPRKVEFADIVTITDTGDCLCPEPRPDGIQDLVLRFSIPDLVANMDRVTTDGRRVVRLRGEFKDCCRFQFRDCVRIVGMPITGGDPLSARHAGR